MDTNIFKENTASFLTNVQEGQNRQNPRLENFEIALCFEIHKVILTKAHLHKGDDLTDLWNGPLFKSPTA
jgi:hypothetical protein